MTNYINLLEIAKDDLDASKFLLKEHFYPQAIFHFGQAIEKTCKYLILKDDIITVNQLNKKIGHDTSKVFTIFTDFLIKKLSEAIEFKNVRKFNDDPLLSAVLNPVEFIDDLQTEIEFFKNPKNRLNELDEDKINHYLGMLKFFNTNIVIENKYSNFYNSEPKVFVDWLIKFHILDEETKNETLEKLNDNIFKEKFYEEIKKIQFSTHEYMRIQQILMTLAVLFSSYAVDTRYPDNNFNQLPRTRFNSSTYIVKKLDEFYKYLDKAIIYLISNQITQLQTR